MPAIRIFDFSNRGTSPYGQFDKRNAGREASKILSNRLQRRAVSVHKLQPQRNILDGISEALQNVEWSFQIANTCTKIKRHIFYSPGASTAIQGCFEIFREDCKLILVNTQMQRVVQIQAQLNCV